MKVQWCNTSPWCLLAFPYPISHLYRFTFIVDAKDSFHFKLIIYRFLYNLTIEAYLSPPMCSPSFFRLSTINFLRRLCTTGYNVGNNVHFLHNLLKKVGFLLNLRFWKHFAAYSKRHLLIIPNICLIIALTEHKFTSFSRKYNDFIK